MRRKCRTTQRSKQDLKHFADEVQRAIANNTLFSGTKPHNSPTRLISRKETSVDKLPEDVSRVDFANWVEELYVYLDGVDGGGGVGTSERDSVGEDSVDRGQPPRLCRPRPRQERCLQQI